MTYAQRQDGVWRELRPTFPVVSEDGTQASWDTFMAWDAATQEAFGGFQVPEPTVPEGKVATGRFLKPDGDRPEWEVAYVDAPPPPEPGPEPVPEVISDRQFAQALAKQGVITKDEALAFVKRGEVPDALQAVIDSIEDPENRFDLDMAVSGATTFERSNPSTVVLAAALQWSAEQMDDLWRFAATIK